MEPSSLSLTSEEHPLSLLIMDGDAVTAEQLTTILQSVEYPHQVTCVNTWSQAVTLVAEHLFHIIFIDLSLSKRPPTEALDQWLHEVPGVPLVVLLPTAQEALSHSLLQRGAQDYLLKTDYTVALLRRSLRYLLTQQKNHQQLIEIAHTDHLTGLANRYLFHDRMTQAMIRAERSKQQVAVLFIDLDDFHGVNETLGYGNGDLLLKETAQRITQSVRRQDTVARLGSDEFAVILEGIQEPQHVMGITRHILSAFSSPAKLAEQEPIFISMSVGIAISTPELLDPQVLIKQADIARYRAKEKGRNTFQYFSPEHNQMAEQCLNLEQAVSYSLAKIFRAR